MHEPMNAIYALSLDGVQFRYVGLTTVGVRMRYQAHVSAVRWGRTTPLYRWIKEHGPENIVHSVLEEVDSHFDLPHAEVLWIDKLRREGYDLLNTDAGGICSIPHSSILSVGYLEPSSDPKSLASFHNATLDAIRRGDDVQLKQYVATVDKDRRKRKRCLTCALDPELLKQIHDARTGDEMISFPTISRWLEGELDRKIQPNTIRNHFVAGHHND